MKKQLLFPVVLLMTTLMFSSFSGGDCKWKEKKTDAISDSKYLKSKNLSQLILGEKVSGNGDKPFLDANIELKEGSIFLNLLFQRNYLMSLEKIQNPKLIIKLKDGTKYEITSEESFATELASSQTTSNMRWKIEKKKVSALAQSEIVALRISFAGEDYNFVTKETIQKQFLKMFDCMNQELQ